MSTQYDSITQLYKAFKTQPGSILERINFQSVVAPHIDNKTVLDLACGAGYYSRLLLEWGARRVVGVDISEQMITEAKRETCEALSFQVGDCSQLTEFEGRPFDVVTAVWLLNYAPNGEVMAAMFRTIAANLKMGGVFYGLVPYPAEDLEAYISQVKRGPWREKFGIEIEFGDEVDDGYPTTVKSVKGAQPFEFHNFQLRKEVFEKSAREGGMRGKLEWRYARLPTKEEDFREDGFWDGVLDTPHFGILVVEK